MGNEALIDDHLSIRLIWLLVTVLLFFAKAKKTETLS